MTWDSLFSLLYIDGVQYILFACFLIGMSIQVSGIACMIWFRFRHVSEVPMDRPAPGVSILKPCVTALDQEERNFDTFFNQEYPGPVEIIFICSHETDSVVPVIRSTLAKYPEFDAKLLISKTRRSFVRKVDSLYDAHQIAKHEIIIWSDSDVAVRPNYLRQMVGTLMEPDVSLVTTPQYDVGANNVATAFKALANICDIGTYISTLNVVAKTKKFAWGHSIGFRRAEFEAFGDYAWDLINRFMADDQSLPYLFAQHGKQTVLRPIYCPAYYANKTWTQMLNQKKRWAVCQRIAFQNVHLPMLFVILAIPQISSLAMMFHSGFSTWSVQLFFVVMATRVFVSFLFEGLYTGSVGMTARYFWTIALADLSQIYFYGRAYGMNTVEFHGKQFRLVDKHFLKEVDPDDEDERTLTRFSKWARSRL